MILMIVVLIRALMGTNSNAKFTPLDNKLSLWLLIAAHVQALIGIVLYFISPYVVFGSDTMSNKDIRYWSVEHIFIMIIAVAFITVARIKSKNAPTDKAKFSKLLVFNGLALILITAAIFMSKRGFF